MAKQWLFKNRLMLTSLLIAIIAVSFLAGCADKSDETLAPESSETSSTVSSVADDTIAVAEARGLSPEDILAAVKTYTPSGMYDDYVMFASGGHGGQVYVIGLPSMRIIKKIAVFTPEPWQGYGYGAKDSMEILAEGNVEGSDREITWGDTHHPALSETDGDYDGEFLFINDKANGRVAVISLKDFETKQIVKNPLTLGDHGGAMVTPDTEWVIEGGQYGSPLGWEYASIDDYESDYRGMVTFWKFDRESGRILEDQSFAIELPPYWQDLCDAGKLASEGWVFCNSFNTELATGGIEEGNPPFESGASQNDTDFLHIFNLDKAVEVAAAGKTMDVKGFPVIPLETAIEEGLLYFAPEPKSPHGVDVTPDGEFLTVSGKLAPGTFVYSFAKIQDAIAAGNFEYDQYGVPILAFDDVLEAEIEVGLGPLHTQYDDKGYAYTSLFLEPAVARWTLGGNFSDLHEEEDWTVVEKTPVQYNVGHIAAAEGDTVSPDGKYLVSLNKWAIDRFLNVGPLLPQNLQLIDINEPGTTMPVIYDLPIPDGEPHYAQIIKADKLDPWEVYPEIGWNPRTGEIDENATQIGEERIVRDGNNVEIWMTAVRSRFNPERVEIRQGDNVTWHITNVERTYDATHGFAIPLYNINLSIEPGETVTFEFEATEDGVFSYYCTEFCSALHLEMTGYLLVEPDEE